MPHVENEIVQKTYTPNPRNNSAIFKIFDNVQYNVVQHKKYAKEMIKLYKKLDENIFRESFKNALHYLFTFGDTSTNVDRVIQFVATFCTSLDDEEEFLMFIFNIIFECQCVSGQSVRYRASQLLAAVLAALGDDASLDDDLCDKLLTSQLQRLQDTRSAVRCRAAMALQRLQNPMESDDEVTRAYLFHMSCDPSSSVRRAILMSIAKCVRNVPFVLERLCDVDDAVRRAAFLYISAIDVKLLRVKQRLHTLKVGLTERNPRVRRVVEEILIPGWLSSFEGNIVYLLKAIRLDNVNDAKDSQYVAGKLLESLFKRLPISELLEWLPTDKNLRLIPAEKLNKETAWYWRHLAEHLQKINDDETLEMVIPDLVVLIGYIRAGLLKPTPPPPPPPAPPKLPPPPEFKKPKLDSEKLKKIEQLRSRPRRRPDWSDMMKEVEEGKKLKHVVCNDRSSPIITTSVVVKNKGQFIFESEKPNSHNELLKEISKGVRLKKVKCNDRSKPILEGLRKFRRQMTIEEQVQKSMSQANLAASPSGVALAEVPAAEEEEIDEMDDIDKVRDDLQSTKQLLAIELRNKEVQERENRRLLTRIQNLEAELARERAFIKQEQHKTVISVTDAYDERLVNSLKMEVDKAKETADSLQKQYLQAAEDRDDALTELEDVKRKNMELEKKLEQALSQQFEELLKLGHCLTPEQKSWLEFFKQCKELNISVASPEAEEIRKKTIDAYNNAFTNNNKFDEGVMPTNVGSRRSSHAVKQLSVTKDDSFEEEEESEEEEEESEEKKQKRLEKDVRNMRNKIRHLKEKQDNMKRERMAYKMSLKNQQAALKDEKKKYKELKREVDKMAAMMKEVGSEEDEEEEDEEEESEDEKKSGSEEEETETETEQDTESETESESEPEDAPLPKKKENLNKRLKRHETRIIALKKGNTLLMANVDRLKDDVLMQKEMSLSLKKELDSLIEDLE